MANEPLFMLITGFLEMKYWILTDLQWIQLPSSSKSEIIQIWWPNCFRLDIFLQLLKYFYNIVFLTVKCEWQSDPELAQVILGNDLNKLQNLLRARHNQRSELRRQEEEEMVINKDPSGFLILRIYNIPDHLRKS